MLQEITLDILLQRMQVVKFLLEKLKKKKNECRSKMCKNFIKKTNENLFTFENVNTSKCKIQNVRVQQHDLYKLVYMLKRI